MVMTMLTNTNTNNVIPAVGRRRLRRMFAGNRRKTENEVLFKFTKASDASDRQL
jgi:hypothetical protein